MRIPGTPAAAFACWVESVGRGSAYSHPPANHLKSHGWLGEAGQWNPGQNGASKLFSGTRIHERLGGGKGHEQKTCRTSEFLQISVIWFQSRNYLEAIKRLLNGNRETRLNSQRATLTVPEVFNFHGLAINLKAN